MLATELSEVEVESQQYHIKMNHVKDEVIILFQPATLNEGNDSVKSNVEKWSKRMWN